MSFCAKANSSVGIRKKSKRKSQNEFIQLSVERVVPWQAFGECEYVHPLKILCILSLYQYYKTQEYLQIVKTLEYFYDSLHYIMHSQAGHRGYCNTIEIEYLFACFPLVG